jgi:arginyl-tRNA synthetase
MSPADHDPVTWLRACVLEATATVRGGAGEPSAPPALERPRRSGQGHFATNAALLLAPVLGAPPREIAERLKDELHARLGARLERSEVAGPGFVNLWMSASWQREALAQVLEAGASLGAGGAHAPERILLEFVSANPTAELVAASGRHAAYGDSLARILAHHGHEVSREYYFNDAGSQIRRLGESVRARALGEPVPEDGYQGEYVAQLARMLVPDRDDARQADVDQLAAGAVHVLLARIKRTLERYGVRFDTYFSERTLHEGSPSPLERAITSLSQAGHTFRADGALFLRTTAFGDEKDRVLVRSTGEPTSPPISPTWRTSSGAASIANCWSSEPITTATSHG